ncbi:MAG: hypothetical protein LQ340_004974 [Diploschistes diacapsis]|nr:MAG: hypothetical protein LQ340_004974 [Diploschistes diacapsis]
MEALQQKHRQEQRDLQARITQKKKNATKRTRKGVNDECADLDRQLRDRQEVELAAVSSNTEKDDNEQEGLQPSHAHVIAHDQNSSTAFGEAPTNGVSGKNHEQPPEDSKPQPKKPSRQKARLARRAAEQEAVATAAAEEAAQQPDRRADERQIMSSQIEARGLVEQEVRSDGHCMYAAVADQLQQHGVNVGSEEEGLPEYRVVRRKAAAFIESHGDDFAPFLEGPLDEYVAKVRDTGEWGGQLELSALSRVYGLVINVLQGDGRVEKIEPGGEAHKEAWLAYYRHSFGLGEHYNSLRKASAG